MRPTWRGVAAASPCHSTSSRAARAFIRAASCRRLARIVPSPASRLTSARGESVQCPRPVEEDDNARDRQRQRGNPGARIVRLRVHAAQHRQADRPPPDCPCGRPLRSEHSGRTRRNAPLSQRPAGALQLLAPARRFRLARTPTTKSGHGLRRGQFAIPGADRNRFRTGLGCEGRGRGRRAQAAFARPSSRSARTAATRPASE